MANQDAPFGLRPVGKVSGNRDSGGTTEYDIAACASAIYQNDPVKMLCTGTIGVAAATQTLIGSINGVFYTDATTSKPTFARYLAASNSATDIVGFVNDDPFTVFEIQSAGSGAHAQGDIGSNADLATYAAGAAPDYLSAVEAVDTQSATAATLRIVGLSKDPDNNDITAANVNWRVLIAEHFYMTTTGI
jgi:hypothetical protein